jgi:hypothetical protein
VQVRYLDMDIVANPAMDTTMQDSYVYLIETQKRFNEQSKSQRIIKLIKESEDGYCHTFH